MKNKNKKITYSPCLTQLVNNEYSRSEGLVDVFDKTVVLIEQNLVFELCININGRNLVWKKLLFLLSPLRLGRARRLGVWPS